MSSAKYHNQQAMLRGSMVCGCWIMTRVVVESGKCKSHNLKLDLHFAIEFASDIGNFLSPFLSVVLRQICWHLEQLVDCILRMRIDMILEIIRAVCREFLFPLLQEVFSMQLNFTSSKCSHVAYEKSIK